MLTEVYNRDKLFEETSKLYKEILQEYFDSPLNVIDGPWEFIPIYDILHLSDDNTSLFESINKNITFVNGYTIIALGVSLFPAGFPESPHIDKHSEIEGFRRYHLPIQLTDTSYLYVKQDNSEIFDKYSWELGKWMEFTGLDKIHYPLNEDKGGISRIVLIMDIIEGDASEKDIYDYYANTEELGWTKDKDFRPYFEKNINNFTIELD